MRLDNALEQARGARTLKQAARLHNGLEYELALGEHPPEHEAQAEEALSHLVERFPGVAEEARDVEEPPPLSRRAGQRLREGGEQAHAQVRRRRPPPREGGTARRAGARRTGTARGAGAAGRRALQLADSSSGGWGATIGDVFLGAVGLSIFYLLITKAAATGKLALGLSNVARAIVSPVVDPLNPKGIH